MTQITDRESPETKVLNVVIWITQVAWGVFFSFTGFGKIMCYRPDVWNFTLHQPVPWFHAVPQSLFVFIGVCEFAGGVGLTLPAVTHLKPMLTPWAAAGLSLVMFLAAVFHVLRGEYAFFLPLNLVLGGVAAFIAYGRWVVRPVAAASVSSLRVITGLAVLGALTLAGLAPIWYQVKHPH